VQCHNASRSPSASPPLPELAGAALTDPRRVLFWGQSFSGSGDVEDAVAAAAEACRGEGLDHLERRAYGDGSVEIVALRGEGRRHRRCGGGLQKVVWRLHGEDGRLHATTDIRMLPHCFVRVLFVAIAAALTLAATALDVPVLTGVSRWLQRLNDFTVLAAVIALAWLYRRLGALGSTYSETLWQRFIGRLETAGGSLEPKGTQSSRRHRFTWFAYAGVFVLSTEAWLLFEWIFSSQDSLFGFWEQLYLAVLLATSALLLVGLVPMVRQIGFTQRVNAIAVGLSSSFDVLFFLALPLISCWLDRRLPPNPVLPREASSRLAAWTLIAGAALLLGLWAFFLRLTLRLSVSARRLLVWDRLHPSWESSKTAAGDISVVRRFRWVFLSVWTVLGLLIVTGLGFASIATVSALGLNRGRIGGDPVEATKMVLACALGLAQEPWPATVARLFWLSYVALVWTAVAASLGQLFLSRRRARRRLRRAAASAATAGGEPALAIFADLCRTAEAPAIRLAVRDHPGIAAWSASFGLFGGERWVEITSGALELLCRDETAALLAHEIAHHLHRRPKRDAVLRWLGRLTFTGDGFSRAVQHSFGYEQEADRTALRLLAEQRIDRGALDRALLKAKHVNPLLDHRSADDSGLPAAPTATAREAIDGAGRRGAGWRRSLAAFVEQYCNGLELHYWHPTASQRLAAPASAAGGRPIHPRHEKGGSS